MVPDEAKPSAGQSIDEPEQVSATSHPPASPRQFVPASASASAGQPSEVPSQVSTASQTPAAPRQLAVLFASAGQAALEPVQVSVTSQMPPEARHCVVFGSKASAGQSSPTPSQDSATSQVPPEARQHVAVMAVSILTAGKPQLAAAVDADGKTTIFGQMRQVAEDWLQAVTDGKTRVTNPNDPTGEDYRTAVTEDNPLWEAVRFGSLSDEVDLTGYPADPLTVTTSTTSTEPAVYKIALSSGVTSGSLTWDALDHVPTVIMQVSKPAGGYDIFAVPSDITESGCNYSLTGETDQTGYELTYQVK